MARTSGIDEVVMYEHWRNQPRVPKGDSEGGQWTDEGASKLNRLSGFSDLEDAQKYAIKNYESVGTLRIFRYKDGKYFVLTAEESSNLDPFDYALISTVGVKVTKKRPANFPKNQDVDDARFPFLQNPKR